MPSSYTHTDGKQYACIILIDPDTGQPAALGGDSSSGAGTKPYYSGRQALAITLADGDPDLVRTSSAFLPDTTVYGADNIGAGGDNITLGAGITYAGYCEITVNSVNDDITEVELAVLDTSELATENVIAKSHKSMTSGTFGQITLRAEILIRPTTTLNATLRIGVKGTGSTVPAEQSANGNTNLKFVIREQG